jgi:UDP-N-acetylmuramoylalanine--D-glutamate ligase
MKALLIGAAVSGRAALRLLESDGYEVVVFDADPAAVADLGVERRVRGGDWDPALLSGVDLVVASPGVPPHTPPITDALAAGVPLWGELELASRHLAVPLLAVTATNGKTTITQMATAMLAASGRRTAAVGNIGVPLSEAVGGDWDALVVEASSFQLRFIDSFHPQVAVLLNVAPDHLDWHGSFEAYLAAKARIHQNQGEQDLLIFDGEDRGAQEAVASARSRRWPVSGRRRPPAGSGPQDGRLWLGEVAVDLAGVPSADPIFLVDAAAAGTAALAVGATGEGIGAALRSFRPPDHRRQVVGTWDGVAWVDDSKATNPHAAVAAIRSYPSVVLIAGGRNKGLDVAAIATEARLRHVIGIGEAGPEMAAAARAGSVAADLEEAVALADRLALPGDTVLLAPGCASFDMFRSYAHRGEVFAEAVRRRKEG